MNLTGNKIKNSYKALLTFPGATGMVSNPTDLKQMGDGGGNNTPLYLSTTQAGLQYTGQTADTTFIGFTLRNNTAAAVGAQQYSPAFVRTSYGWETTGGTSQSISFRDYVVPVQGATLSGSYLNFGYSINGVVYTNIMALGANSNVSIGTVTYFTAKLNVAKTGGSQIHVIDTDSTYYGRVNYDQADSTYYGIWNGHTGAAAVINFGFGTGSIRTGAVMTLLQTGIVGIGTIVALGTTARLSVKGAAAKDILYLQKSDATLALSVGVTGNTIINGTTGNVLLLQNATVDTYAFGVTGRLVMSAGTGTNGVLTITNSGAGDYLNIGTSAMFVTKGEITLLGSTAVINSSVQRLQITGGINAILPTSDAGLVQGDFYTSVGVVMQKL